MMKKYKKSLRIDNIVAPLVSVLGGIVIGAIFLVLSGHNPLIAYKELFIGAFGGGDFTNFAATLSRLAPIVGMTMSCVISFRSGFLNIGGEGQLIIGGLSAALVAVYVPVPNYILLPLTFLVGAFAAGIYSLLAAFLQFKFNVPLIISTLLLNYPARYISKYFVTNVFRETSSLMIQTKIVPEGIRFPLLVPHTQLHAGVLIILLIVILVIVIDKKTVKGYEIRLTGLNRKFSEFGGINSIKLGYMVLFTSGAIAGIVGTVEVLGISHRFIDGALVLPQYAWTGLTAALLANSNPVGATLASIFFSALQTGAYGMERNTDVARELSRLLQSLIIMLITASPVLDMVKQRLARKRKK